jgi:hypothetical protein
MVNGSSDGAYEVTVMLTPGLTVATRNPSRGMFWRLLLSFTRENKTIVFDVTAVVEIVATPAFRVAKPLTVP